MLRLVASADDSLPAASKPFHEHESDSKSILFLQSMPNRFFGRLGTALVTRGHDVHRINFNAGDKVFWPLDGAVDYRGRAEDWPDFLQSFIASKLITDIILFGDCRPLHRTAIRCAKGLNVSVHVCEEGYIRPNWVTFERDGVNGHSTLPRDPAWFRREAAKLPPREPETPISSSFARRAWEDVVYNVATLTFSALYPHYRTHRPHHRLIEYAGWSWKVMRRPLSARRARSQAKRLWPATKYFLFPMQLNCDSQIREHSGYNDIGPIINRVLASFANHADSDIKIVFKEHPLDDGLINWRPLLNCIASRHGITDRLIYLEVGDVNALIAGSVGVVTVNSTVGMLALEAKKPLLALGKAIYDIEGLTHRLGLDTFWTTPTLPDDSLFIAFREVLVSRCLLAGDLFSDDGLNRLVRSAVERLEVCAPSRDGTAVEVLWNKCVA